jgi:hypothetical protein
MLTASYGISTPVKQVAEIIPQGRLEDIGLGLGFLKMVWLRAVRLSTNSGG